MTGHSILAATSFGTRRRAAQRLAQSIARRSRHHFGTDQREKKLDTLSRLVAEMRIEHEVRQIFDDASPGERDNMIRYLEVLIRNLKGQAGNE